MPYYPKSDHYDGQRFFNPTNPIGNSLWDGAKMFLTTSFDGWPDHLENFPLQNLHQPVTKNEVAVTFVNHATVLVQTNAFNFLTDPVWSERVTPVSFVGPKRHRDPGVPFVDLPKIDFVIISHNHYDHLDLPTLKKLDEEFHPMFFVPLGNKSLLQSIGIKNIVELDWWESFQLGDGAEITLTPAEHFSGRGAFDRNQSLWGSYLVKFDQHKIYFGGDSAYGSHFKEIYKRIGSPDIAFLPIGAYAPRWFMKVIHMNPEEAVQAHLDFQAKQSVGVHFGTFQLTSEKINQPQIDLKASLKQKNIVADEFITLPEGQTRNFKLNEVDLNKINKIGVEKGSAAKS